MRSPSIWPTSISGWCYWASIAGMAFVAALLSAAIALGPILRGGAADVVIWLMVGGVSGAFGTFLFGLLCNLRDQ